MNKSFFIGGKMNCFQEQLSEVRVVLLLFKPFQISFIPPPSVTDRFTSPLRSRNT